MNEQQIEMSDQILEELGLENISEPVKKELIETIRDRVAQTTMIVLMKNLPESEISALEQAIENKNEEEIIQEMSTRIPDLNEKLSLALADLYNKLIKETKKILANASQNKSDLETQNPDQKSPNFI